ncbi:GGDEF domain-containing protein [Paenibacillus flagellatus]|uniref:GGDEF domain-containing protein n=1 Tax=Paenibacillus flagellatus TaxID=2211139 RepID=A0A2V5KAH3_9BACL|nr:GGDEF domain-containing protein [Paenibacillus flagellatus]PYI50820.1 GGDEF domain-containing protein [Paenibacillus flagellatus]
MNDFLIPVTNSCTLITLSYVAIKLRNRVIGGTNEMVLVPLFTGLSSVLMMLLPIPADLIINDLRYIPIIMAGLRLGLPVALLSTIPPAAYGLWLQQPYLIYELLHGLLFPALISSFLHRKEYRSGFEPLRLVDGVKIAVLLFAVKTAAGILLFRSDWLHYAAMNGYMFVITLLCLLVLIALHNDENKTWLLQRQLELEANQDRLTGLPNFRSFLEIAGSTLKKRRISIFMIDIDNFKNFNDTLGHLQGDQLLREAGSLMRGTIGEKDYIARYGGEEFIVMCDSVDRNLVAFLAHRLCDEIAAYPFVGREVQPDKAISISIGIAVSERPGDDLYRLIAEADQALYVSKRGGKNRYTFFDNREPLSLYS